MAEVTVELVNIRGLTVLTVTHDDTTELLDRLDLETDRSTLIELWRGGSPSPWRGGTVAAGSYTYQAGGAVKRLNDLTRLVVSVDS